MPDLCPMPLIINITTKSTSQWRNELPGINSTPFSCNNRWTVVRPPSPPCPLFALHTILCAFLPCNLWALITFTGLQAWSGHTALCSISRWPSSNHRKEVTPLDLASESLLWLFQLYNAEKLASCAVLGLNLWSDLGFNTCSPLQDGG